MVLVAAVPSQLDASLRLGVLKWVTLAVARLVSARSPAQICSLLDAAQQRTQEQRRCQKAGLGGSERHPMGKVRSQLRAGSPAMLKEADDSISRNEGKAVDVSVQEAQTTSASIGRKHVEETWTAHAFRDIYKVRPPVPPSQPGSTQLNHELSTEGAVQAEGSTTALAEEPRQERGDQTSAGRPGLTRQTSKVGVAKKVVTKGGPNEEVPQLNGKQGTGVRGGTMYPSAGAAELSWFDLVLLMTRMFASLAPGLISCVSSSGGEDSRPLETAGGSGHKAADSRIGAEEVVTLMVELSEALTQACGFDETLTLEVRRGRDS